MNRIGTLAGYAWASPLTLLGLAYAGIFNILGWYRWAGCRGHALVWFLVPDKAPRWVSQTALYWGGHSLGNVVVLKRDTSTERGRMVLLHEQEHVRQFMTLGIFQPVLYSLAWVCLVIGCPRSHSHYSNPFEVEARRAAGQVIDVEKALEQLRESARKKSATQ